jgi:hypothetical protein
MTEPRNTLWPNHGAVLPTQTYDLQLLPPLFARNHPMVLTRVTL